MTTLKNMAVAVASLVIFTNITNAQTAKTSYSVNYEEPMKVKYLGDDAGYLSFEVTFTSSAPNKSKFTIEDKNQMELYAVYFESNPRKQTIKIEKNDFKGLNFNLFLGKKMYSKSFSVNTSLVEMITVAENDLTKL